MHCTAPHRARAAHCSQARVQRAACGVRLWGVVVCRPGMLSRVQPSGSSVPDPALPSYPPVDPTPAPQPQTANPLCPAPGGLWWRCPAWRAGRPPLLPVPPPPQQRCRRRRLSRASSSSRSSLQEPRRRRRRRALAVEARPPWALQALAGRPGRGPRCSWRARRRALPPTPQLQHRQQQQQLTAAAAAGGP